MHDQKRAPHFVEHGSRIGELQPGDEVRNYPPARLEDMHHAFVQAMAREGRAPVEPPATAPSFDHLPKRARRVCPGRRLIRGVRLMRHLPPVPFSYETNAPIGQHEGKGFVYLLDANGRKIGTVWGTADEKLALAELICNASDRVKHERDANFSPAATRAMR